MIAIMCFLSLFYDVSSFCAAIAKSSGVILVMNPENCLKNILQNIINLQDHNEDNEGLNYW